MVFGPDVTRRLRPDEEAEADDLLRAAFARDAEADLVRALRAGGHLWQESVQPWAGRIGGYMATVRLTAPEGWACLCPVAVRPGWQRGTPARDPRRRGSFRFGSRMLSGLRTVLEIGHERGLPDVPRALLALGAAPFFEQAGFSTARAQNLSGAFGAFAVTLLAPGHDAPAARVDFPPPLAAYLATVPAPT